MISILMRMNIYEQDLGSPKVEQDLSSCLLAFHCLIMSARVCI